MREELNERMNDLKFLHFSGLQFSLFKSSSGPQTAFAHLFPYTYLLSTYYVPVLYEALDLEQYTSQPCPV